MDSIIKIGQVGGLQVYSDSQPRDMYLSASKIIECNNYSVKEHPEIKSIIKYESESGEVSYILAFETKEEIENLMKGDK